MKILVSNIGSTSFKFRLFEMDGPGEREIASGGADRIGEPAPGDAASSVSTFKLQVAAGQPQEQSCQAFVDHGAAIRHTLEQLVAVGALNSTAELDAVAFKAIMAGDCPPVAIVDDKLLEQMEYFIPVAPAHNPPYIAAMRMFADELGDTPLVAAFEPGFHQTMPPRRRYYAVPPEWADRYGVKRYGYHGASHGYIAKRTVELMGPDNARAVISCHLGGSSSICAIRDGKSVATSMGLSPQSGLPQGKRSGDFDPFAFALLARQGGMSVDEILTALGGASGLAALSGTGGDMRDIRKAADQGDRRAKLARDVFVTAVRDYIGAYLVELGGADAIVFTGGIGQHDRQLRTAVCEGMEFAGVSLDADKNDIAAGECRIDSADSSTAVWVMETNEELIVARQAAELLGERALGNK